MSKFPSFSNNPDYKIGYGKPPTASRFKKGVSGNPKGRPKGARNKMPKKMLRLHEMLLEEAKRDVTIQDKSGPLSMPVAQAAMRSLALKAAQGSVSAQKLFLQSVSHAENEDMKERTETLVAAIEYKERTQNEIRIAASKGQNIEKEILPHPDHVIIDTRAGRVTIRGPIDEEDLKFWNETWQRKADFELELEEYKKDLEQPDLDQELVMRDILHSEYILTLIELTIIKRWDLPIEDVVSDYDRRRQIRRLIKNDELPERPNSRAKVIE